VKQQSAEREGGSPSRRKHGANGASRRFHQEVCPGRSSSRRKPEVRRTGITDKAGTRRKPRAGRAGVSREDGFQVSRELITGGARRFGARRKPRAGRLVQPEDSETDGCWSLAVAGASRRTQHPVEARGLVASLAGEPGSRRKPEATTQAMPEAQHRRRKPKALLRASWRLVFGEGRGLTASPGEDAAEGASRKQQASLAGAQGRRRKPEARRTEAAKG